MQVKLISKTVPVLDLSPTAESLIGFCARVSNPANQDNPDVEKLLKYCIRKGHWSIFEMADMTVEITTGRDISAQLLRHRSFSFQEFSTRYAAVESVEPIHLRLQDDKNRQASHDVPFQFKEDLEARIANHVKEGQYLYGICLKNNVAKETARRVLPLATTTKIYMKGSIRSWITYFMARCGPETQLEHREIALAIREIFKQEFPLISSALEY